LEPPPLSGHMRTCEGANRQNLPSIRQRSRPVAATSDGNLARAKCARNLALALIAASDTREPVRRCGTAVVN